ncbi:DUF2188 domain-containing protein [Rhodococcus pyridinivorans]|uniref:DUF2188 domain-containing protein n=1 Tax=Rhodococcus pyridinivorans TaxID=103816 RepID=UPI001E447555|nr:DUF2188 domain-containing protein [Rhodococcus pyridinivorans]UGQ56200.1 DUF2188 domain-containing protein [Rhodococcus pyridinivorans]
MRVQCDSRDRRDSRDRVRIRGDRRRVRDGQPTVRGEENPLPAGRDEARRRKVEHLVHNLDGTIGERNTYGHDPRDIPG